MPQRYEEKKSFTLFNTMRAYFIEYDNELELIIHCFILRHDSKESV